MSKHTPGEWVVNYDEVCVRSTADDQSYGMLIPIAAVMDEDQEANARLISAAPDLLAAAQKALAECVDLIATPAGDALRVAIAKATGEPA